MTAKPTNTNPPVEFDGEVVRLGSKDYVIPSLSVKQAKKLWPEILDLDKGITAENLADKWSSAIPIIHAALSRNYPNLKIEDVEEFVEIANLRKLLMIVSGQSGIRPGGEKPDASESPETEPTTPTATTPPIVQ